MEIGWSKCGKFEKIRTDIWLKVEEICGGNKTWKSRKQPPNLNPSCNWATLYVCNTYASGTTPFHPAKLRGKNCGRCFPLEGNKIYRRTMGPKSIKVIQWTNIGRFPGEDDVCFTSSTFIQERLYPICHPGREETQDNLLFCFLPLLLQLPEIIPSSNPLP